MSSRRYIHTFCLLINCEKYSPVVIKKNNVMLQKKADEVEKDEENLEFQKEHARKLNFSRRRKFV
ncbi:hypothetical protein ACOSQ2_026940 [Xanthoceras sorbifolium]